METRHRVWLAPVPATLLTQAAATVLFAADAVALCPRAAVSDDWACKPPSTNRTLWVGSSHTPALSVLGTSFLLADEDAPPSPSDPAALRAALADSARATADALAAKAPFAVPSERERAAEVAAARAAEAAHQKVALVIVGRCKQDRVSYGMFFEAFRSRVVDRYRRDGHSVDVIFCSDLNASVPSGDLGGAMALRRLQPYSVFDVEATSQFDRMDKCFTALRAAKGGYAPYDWYFRTRPDLMLWDDAPALEGLDKGAIHARIMSAQNMSGLVYANFASESASCWPEVCTPGPCVPPGAPCAVYDDQLALVPRAQADAYFMEPKSLPGAVPLVPECEWVTGGFPEHFFMRNTLKKGGRFAPLALEARLVGYKDGDGGGFQKPENEGKAKPCPPYYPDAQPA